MNKNIQKTKKKLTFIFSIVVFIIIFVLWITFFSFKYFREVSVEKKEFSNLIKFVENWKVSINDIILFGNRFKKEAFLKKRVKANLQWPFLNWNFKPKWFINYLLIKKDWNIISSNIKDDISSEFIISVTQNDNYLKLVQEWWFLIKKFILENGNKTFIIIKNLRYGLSDYLNDIFGFLIINILFSIVLYFIGFKFVNNAFVPVEENMKDMKNFIHNAGHELKTPISVIDSNIQLIDDIKKYDADMTKELKNEVLRLNSIIDWLIKLSNIDLFKDIVNNDLKTSIELIVNEFKFKITEKKLKINIDLPDNINIKSSKDYFYIFLSNIIWNAIKYNKVWWTINIIYNNWKLEIKDSWIWIDKKDLNKIFDRFFKWDKSRKSDWFGIWLSLVKKIWDIFNWDILVKSKDKEWTSFIINFFG